MERKCLFIHPAFQGLQVPQAHPLLQSHIRTQSSEELTEIPPCDEMGGSMAGFLRLAAGSAQSVLFLRAQPAAEVLYFPLRCRAWTHKNQSLTTVVTGGPDWRVC